MTTIDELAQLARRHLPEVPATTWRALLLPGVHLRHASTGDEMIGQLGGLPRLGGQAWPTSDGGDLTHVLSLDCGALAALLPDAGFPARGSVAFFHRLDAYEAPAHVVRPWDALRSTAQVRYVEDSAAAQTPAPEGVPVFTSTRMAAEPAVTWPRWEQPDVPNPRRGLPDEIVNAMDDELTELTLAGGPVHQVGGYPDLVQDAVQFHFAEAELFDDTDRDHLDWDDAEPLMAGWFLLAQIDSDYEAATVWGDSGVLYYGIRPADLRAGRFDRVRFVWHSA